MLTRYFEIICSFHDSTVVQPLQELPTWRRRKTRVRKKNISGLTRGQLRKKKTKIIVRHCSYFFWLN